MKHSRSEAVIVLLNAAMFWHSNLICIAAATIRSCLVRISRFYRIIYECKLQHSNSLLKWVSKKPTRIDTVRPLSRSHLVNFELPQRITSLEIFPLPLSSKIRRLAAKAKHEVNASSVLRLVETQIDLPCNVI